MEEKEKNPEEMLRSKVGEAMEREKQYNRVILIGLTVMLIGSILFVMAKSCLPRFPHINHH